LLIVVKWTLVARSPIEFAPPFLNVNPGELPLLPFAASYLLIAAWLVFVGALFRSLLAHDTLNVPKLVYLGVQCSVVLIELVYPSWGLSIAAGIHGLEYFLLTRRMLAPTRAEPESKLTAGLCVPAMIGAMAPILAVGIFRNPLLAVTVISDRTMSWLLMIVNATVLAHFCADAFIYRFRIPSVRKVALERLGF
jgi:hypothetical protein